MPDTRWFVLGQTLSALRADLVVDRVDDSGWSTWLHDPRTGQQWRESRLYGHLQGGGVRYLIRIPEPSPGELIQIAFGTGTTSEAWAASALLSELPEQFSAVMEAAARHAADGKWERVGNVIAWTGLDMPVNRRPVLGKQVAEIHRDHEYFMALAVRATSLREQAEAATGSRFRSEAGGAIWPQF